MQTLIWYEALLSRGLHPALVGGSDRHTLFLMGFPTSYIQVETEDVEGVLAGIQARHTFVARTPMETCPRWRNCDRFRLVSMIFSVSSFLCSQSPDASRSVGK